LGGNLALGRAMRSLWGGGRGMVGYVVPDSGHIIRLTQDGHKGEVWKMTLEWFLAQVAGVVISNGWLPFIIAGIVIAIAGEVLYTLRKRIE
jgi:hypothetical protein